MHSRDKLGAIGEAKVIAELIKQDYIVFTQFDGKAPFDLVAFNNNSIDILAIYVLPEDKVILIDAKTVKPKHQLSIKQASIV